MLGGVYAHVPGEGVLSDTDIGGLVEGALSELPVVCCTILKNCCARHSVTCRQELAAGLGGQPADLHPPVPRGSQLQ